MPTTFSSPDSTQLSTAPERAVIPNGDGEAIRPPVLADAEEEEIAELWAADPGNQGS